LHGDAARAAARKEALGDPQPGAGLARSTPEAAPGRQNGSMMRMAKRTEASFSAPEEAALDSGDRAGLRSALPYRLERLREAEPGNGDGDGNTPSDTQPLAGETIVWRPSGTIPGLGARPVPTVVDAHVGTRIRLRRRQLGVGQATLAQALGIGVRQLQAHERGVERIPAGRLRDIGRVLGTSLSYFFGDLAAELGVPSAVSLPDGPETRALVEAQYALEDPELLRQILALMEPRRPGQ
jgi:transcriptional regulator with XRE-family HTH domain